MRLHKIVINQIKSFEKKFIVYNNIYVSRSALLHNFDLLTKLSPGGLVIPVLKSNAYGHGLQQIAKILKSEKPPYIAVDGYFETLRIHEVSKQKVLIMGSIHSDNFKVINPRGFAFVVHDKKTVQSIGANRKKFVVHIEIETGMGRHGVRIDDLTSLLKILKRYKNITVEGVMTHLADADNPDDTSHLLIQTERFDRAVEMITAAGFKPKYFHIAQSAGSAKVESKYANAVRSGLALYGISPLEPSDKFAKKYQDLKPVLSLTSTISKTLKIDKNESVSYNRKFIAKRDSLIGVMPIGYYEGLPRALSCVGKVKFNSDYLPIVGRVCMNHTMIDITKSNASFGNEITIISSNPNDKLSVKNIRKDYQLFNYGLLTSLNENIRRTIID